MEFVHKLVVKKAQGIQHIPGAGELVGQPHHLRLVVQHTQHTVQPLFSLNGHLAGQYLPLSNDTGAVVAGLSGAGRLDTAALGKGLLQLPSLQFLLGSAQQALGRLIGENHPSLPVGGHQAVLNGVEHVLLFEVQLQQLGGMVSFQGAPQQSYNSPGQPHTQQQDHPQDHQGVDHDHPVLLPDVGGKDGGHHKTNDLSLVIFHCVEGPALGAVGTVSGGDIGLAALQDGDLLPFHKGLTALLAVSMIKAQAAGVVDHDHVQVLHVLAQAVQLPGHLRVGVAPLQHGLNPVQLGNVGGAAADGIIHAPQLPGDIHIQHDPHGHKQQNG